ncbi:MAG: type II toxin-antitoxin system prevent-host-death family antitoxin [Actinomycetota bacterium]|nr:type II toxin-antitoxin system prevent-host-death family antitoxin [Actinomycetota bacterium]
MSEVGIRALKQNASAVVAKAAAGELVTITDRGRPVAQMIPLPSSRIEALIAAERARPARRRLADLPAPVPRRKGRSALSEELKRMRQTERY